MHLRTLHDRVAAELPRLFSFAFVASASRSEALTLVALALDVVARDPEPVLSTPRPADVLLQVLVAVVEERLGCKADQKFEVLVDLHRREKYQHADAPPVTGSRGSDLVLRTELKRTCLVTVLTQLGPSVRIAFILVDILGYPMNTAAAFMQVSERVLHLRLTRARDRIGEYLRPRCGHIDPYNICSCAGILSSALEVGFVKPPPVPQAIPLDPPPMNDMGVLYRSLPGAVLDVAERERLIAPLWTTPTLRPSSPANRG